jgi:hypothetical protein
MRRDFAAQNHGLCHHRPPPKRLPLPVTLFRKKAEHAKIAPQFWRRGLPCGGKQFKG